MNAAAQAALHAVRDAARDAAAGAPVGHPGGPAPVAVGFAATVIATPPPSSVAPPAPRLPPERAVGTRGPNLQLQQKLLRISKVEDKVPREVLLQCSGITKRGIQYIYSKRQAVWAAAEGGTPRYARCAQKCRFPHVNSLLFDWFVRLRRLGRKAIPISCLALSEKAKQLAREHYTGVKLTGSNGFVDRWKKRHNIKNIHLHGSGGATDMVEGERRMAVLRAKMVGMDPDLILNMYEATLCYQLAPT